MAYPVTDRVQLEKNRAAMEAIIQAKCEAACIKIAEKAEAGIVALRKGAAEQLARYKRDWADEDAE